AYAGPAGLIGDILPLLWETPPREEAPVTADQVTAKWLRGAPLIRDEALGIDLPAFQARWAKICAAVGRHQDGKAPAALANAMRRGTLDAKLLTQQILAGRPEEVHGQADALGLDPGLLALVLRLTLYPVLTHVAAALAPHRQAASWERGYCPTCGSWPLLGE